MAHEFDPDNEIKVLESRPQESSFIYTGCTSVILLFLSCIHTCRAQIGDRYRIPTSFRECAKLMVVHAYINYLLDPSAEYTPAERTMAEAEKPVIAYLGPEGSYTHQVSLLWDLFTDMTFFVSCRVVSYCFQQVTGSSLVNINGTAYTVYLTTLFPRSKYSSFSLFSYFISLFPFSQASH